MSFWNSLAFFYNPTDVGNLISGSSVFAKSSLNIWKFSVHILLKEKMETVTVFISLGPKITVESNYSHEIKRHLLLGRKAMTNLDSILKSRDITLSTKVSIVKAMVFPVVMYGLWKLDHKEGWELKNWYFWTVMLQKTLESPLDCKEIKPVNPKGNQPWIFIGRTDAEAEAPRRWSPDVESWLIGNYPDTGKY